ncbi:MAG: molybdopterin-dependent oxidoreductase [Anaerolineae bacterium]|nr:molybdopterin-dependent oxidoreductase [Anaerolineae bacterium]
MYRLRTLFGAAFAGAASVVAIEAILLSLWIVLNIDYAPKRAADFIIEHTPPDHAIALQKTLGPFAFPSALMGGVMFVATIGLLTGLAYTLIKPRSRSLAILAASILQPAATWFCYPNMTIGALAPLLLTGLILDFFTHRDLVNTTAGEGITRRQVLKRLALFSLGGLAVSIVGGVPIYLAELRSVGAGRRLFAFTLPEPRVPGFYLADLAPEVTPVEDFYKMRKSPKPVPGVPINWKLTVDGLVEHPLTLTMDDLLTLPRTDMFLTRQCISNPVGGNLISTALMSGVLLNSLMIKAGIKPGAVDLVFYGRDEYVESVPVAYAREHGLLTYAMNGVALPEIHGAPVRVEVPGLYGFKNMKWLDRIEVVDKHYVAIWEAQGWTSNPVVKTMSRIDAIFSAGDRALIAGVAFAGIRGIKTVEVQINGGDWQPAILNTPALSNQTWVQWQFNTPQRGTITVAVRATDSTGAPQIATAQQQFPDGASGYHTVTVTL